MVNIVYLEMAIVSIVILSILLYKVRAVLGFFQEYYLFSLILKLTIISTGLECFTYIFDEKTFYMADTVNTFVNASYFAVSIIISFYWLCFVAQLLNIDILASKKSIFLLGLPAGVSVILSIASIWTGFFFEIDKTNTYIRGDFYPFYVVCNSFYLIFSSYMCLQRVFMKQYYLDREMNLSLAFFAIFPIISIIIQIIWDDLTMSSPGVVIAILLFFIMMLVCRITADPLTGLNNKSQLLRFLHNRMPHLPRGTRMYLFVLNVNNIKAINRKYGYNEGDKALVFIANILKPVCGPQGCFINRGDGDTFNLATVMNNDEEADALVNLIMNAMDERTKKLFYDLTLTIAYSSEIFEGHIPDLFIKAESNLKEKKLKK